MHRMNNLEYSFMAAELGRELAGRHFNRIRRISEGKYRMKIGSAEVVAECGVRINITRYIEPSEGDKFTEKVGKELENAKLSSVRQVNGDRILSFDFESRSGPCSLVFEMFGEGNAVLVRDGKTVCAHRYESWSDREIKAGAGYKPPKTAPSDKLEVSGKYIIVSLMKLPLGKEYALEALARAGIDEKAPGDSLSGNRIMGLENAIKSIRSEARPYGFFRGGKMEDFALARLSRHQDLEARELPTLCEAADEYYAHAEKENPKLAKLLERLGKQKERIAALEAEEGEQREKGDFVYAHYQEADALIALARAGEFDELEKRGAKIDRKERSIEVDIQ
jgi:predicted ribosome quality control (RQC) complex YloA/Tae2 family protein